MKKVFKRVVMGTTAAFLVAGTLTGCKMSCPFTTNKVVKMDNSEFYKNGKFDSVKAKEAYFDLMRSFNYPIYDCFKGDDLWCIDFGLGDFVNVGMGGIFWVNRNFPATDKYPQGGYLGHDIFLLPGQMIVEHRHEAVDGVCPPKRESWLVRHGSVYSFSQQKKATPFPDGVKIPESQKGKTTVNSCKLVKEGEVDHLGADCMNHFIMAGPKGAIVTEFATFHSNDGLRFTNPKVKF